MAVEIKNKKAAYQYFLEDEFDAGMQLVGSEIKSIRAGKASIVEGYCRFKNNELWVYNTYIAEYENSGYVTHKPKRPRKLLLKRHELDKLQKKMKNVGLTIVPILVYIGDSGFAKMKIAIAKGKKLHDKRSDLKEKSLKRDIDRALR
ncbi:MAG: SsrA-binding protein SmpB [Flavobacteriales bacterium]|nr:SsrA-binding protein SmpB [Flavobacteriales bacterium]